MSPISRQTIGFIAVVIIVGAGAGVGGYYLGYNPGYDQGRASLILTRANTDVTGTLTVFEWSGYELEEFWDTFKVMYPNVKVEFSFFVDEAEALTKLQAGFEADIAHPCFASVPRWKDAGVIEPLNTSLIPNWEDIFENMTANIEEGTMFGGEHYFVPVDWGYSTILYRPDKLEELGIPKKDPVTGAENWDNYTLLFNNRPELANKISLMDSAVEVMGMAAIAAGVPAEDVWNMTDAQLEDVAAKLEEGKPMVRTYWETPDDVVLMMAGEDPEIVAANVWGESAITLQNEGWNVTFSKPVQGRFSWTCGFSIVDGFKERKPELWEAAHAFINAWLDPAAGAYLIDSYWYGHSNSKAQLFVEDVETMTALGFDSTDVLAESIIWEYTPNEDEWVLIWTEYRA
jgi:spermidine/putrescine transport system substrate-binding protein